MEVRGQLHAPAALSPGENPVPIQALKFVGKSLLEKGREKTIWKNLSFSDMALSPFSEMPTIL
jgi:hypothetical protein